MAPRVIFLMADYGHDPTGPAHKLSRSIGSTDRLPETAIPWQVFMDSGFDVAFATEQGKMPACDEKMLSGWTGALLGANTTAKKAYHSLATSCENFQHPLSFQDPSFSLDSYDLVFLPGGHEKRVRQIIDSPRAHELLASYFPQTQKPSRKSLAAICHGVQVLATASLPDGRSVIHDATTTALPAFMEQGIFHATKLVLGDYYKTYGAGTDSVEEVVKKRLHNRSQFASSINPVKPYVLQSPSTCWHGSLWHSLSQPSDNSSFVVEDPKYNYLSARFPPDAELLAQKAVEMVKKAAQVQ